MGLVLFLLLNLLASLVRVARGPTLADRFLVCQLFGSTGAAMLLLLSMASGQRSLQDVALVFAVLTPVTSAAFLRFALRRSPESDQ